MKINELIIKPIVTEKSTDRLKNNYYLFEVNPRSTKTQIKEALEKLYSVRVAKVRSINRQGKLRRVGRKQSLKKLPTRKIVYVKLKEGKIDIFPKT